MAESARRHRDAYEHHQLHAPLTPTDAYSPSGLHPLQHPQLQQGNYQTHAFGLPEYHPQPSPKASFYPITPQAAGTSVTPLQSTYQYSYPGWHANQAFDHQRTVSPQLSVEESVQPFGDWNLWDYTTSQNLDANVYRSSPHLTPHYPSYEHKRASSTSSHASFGPHTPRQSLIPRVEVYDSDCQGYNNNAGPSTIHWPEEAEWSVSEDEVKQLYQVFGVQENGGQSEGYTQQRNLRDVQRPQDPRIRQLMMSQDSTGSGIARMGPPALPRTESTDTDSGCRLTTDPPKLDRTMSDIYADSLYNPNLHQDPSTPPKNHGNNNNHETSPNAMVMRERLAAANNDHLSAQSQMRAGPMGRERSPFKEGAPESPRESHFPRETESQPRLGSAYKMREWEKAQRDRAAAAQHGPSKIKSEMNEASRTISPKEVALDYEEDEVASKMGSLFSEEPPVKRRKQDHEPSNLKPTMTRESTRGSNASEGSQPSFGSMATSRRESTQSNGRSSMNYPFFAQAQRQASSASNATMNSEPSNEFPQLTSTDSSRSEERPRSRKRTLTATSGKMYSQGSESADPEELTYTCTYHNCTKRFDSQSALQKHKRDIHHSTAHHSRNTSITGAAASPTTATSSRTGSTAAPAPQAAEPEAADAETEDVEGHEVSSDEIADRNSQAGPHICNRINPSTGRPCNSHFSRPYDLTRHEDTIHNNKKQKVRCMYCKDEKTFSRNDALTRHMRVVHPEVNFAGKEKKGGRGG